MSPDDLGPERAEGGEAELAAFLREHWNPLFKMINAKMSDVQAANDIRQETATAFTVAWRADVGLKGVDNHVAFLLGIANKKIMKYYRDSRAKFRELAGAGEAEEDAADTGAETAFRASERYIDLQRLPLRLKQAVFLVDFLDYTQVKAAEILGISVGTLKKRLDEGRREYATHLATSHIPVQIETAREDTR